MSNTLDAACEYLRCGYRPVPIPAGKKGPILPGWQKLRLAEDDLPRHFGGNGNIGLILGKPSGGLIDVDLDCEEARRLADQYLPPTPAITGRPSAPGSHRWYIADGVKTAKHKDPVDKKMIVELRSTGCQTVVGPSIHPSGERYDVLSGEPARVAGPMLAACVEALAKAVIKGRHRERPPPTIRPQSPDVRPCGDPLPRADQDVERRAVAYLAALPPAVSGQGGHGATYTAAVSLVHGFGLKPDHALHLLIDHYNSRCQPEWTEKELRHKVEDAAKREHDRPYGWLRDAELPAEDPDVDLSAFCVSTPGSPPKPKPPPGPDNPGPLPDEMLRVPGFISEVMDLCLATAPYPNLSLAFCGALALQAFLAGRKVRDPGDNRTNIYLLGLGYSASGKDWPRKINTRIVHEIGLAGCIGDRFASGEGVQDALLVHPCMLFQTDEIDGMLQSINRAKDPRHGYIMNMLLTLYSASNSVFPVRPKAGNPNPGAIDQPNLVIFGTAIPNHYYEALSERMLTNGFFARMLILEAGRRSEGQEPGMISVPERVLATAKWWADFRPGAGNLQNWHPDPAVVEHTDAARRLLVVSRKQAEAEYAKAEERNDPVGTTVWGRVSEQTRKLALLYAVSESQRSPRIDKPAIEWASQLVMHQTRRMLFMAAGHVADNPFHAECLKFKEKLRGAPSRRLKHSVLLKRMKTDAKSFRVIVDTLFDQGDIRIQRTPRDGSAILEYELTE